MLLVLEMDLDLLPLGLSSFALQPRDLDLFLDMGLSLVPVLECLTLLFDWDLLLLSLLVFELPLFDSITGLF